MDDPWGDVQESGRWVLELERAFEPDVIHLNSYGHGTLRFRAPVALTAHSCVVSWWAAVKGEPVPARWNRYRQEVENALKAVDCVIAPSRAMLRMLEENYGPDLPPTRAVPNGRRALQFHPSHKEKLVLGAGRLWDEGKNIAALAHAAERLPWPVYVAGASQNPGGKTTGLGACHALGPLSSAALAAWYGKAAIFAHPARYEPFGLCVLEAALSGCALVLGDIESLREIWGDGALYVPPDDREWLETSIRELIENPALRTRSRPKTWPGNTWKSTPPWRLTGEPNAFRDLHTLPGFRLESRQRALSAWIRYRTGSAGPRSAHLRTARWLEPQESADVSRRWAAWQPIPRFCILGSWS